MRFAHISDCHLGAWSGHPDMKDYPLIAFEKALDTCIEKKADFILLAGDVFDSPLPGIDVLKAAAACLRKIREHGISVYAIAGSHDFSPTGKTMLSVLEAAGLLHDAAKADAVDGKLHLKFLKDKAGAKITGMFGRKRSLDASYYENMKVEEKEGFKIFMFHCGISEYKPLHLKEMDAMPLSLLPKGFDYYAGGHVHHSFADREKMVVFPGSLFPTDAQELESYDSGFYMAEYSNGKLSLSRVPVKLFDVLLVDADADNKTAKQAEDEIRQRIEKEDVAKRLVLLKIKGTLASGRPSDIDFAALQRLCHGGGAIGMKRNTGQLSSREFEEVKVRPATREGIEEQLIAEHASQGRLAKLSAEEIAKLTHEMMDALKHERGDETKNSHEEGLKKSARKILGI